MVRLDFDIGLHYTVLDDSCDFVFNIHAARTRRQTVLQETLEIDQPVATALQQDAATGTRLLRLRARAGPLALHYRASVAIEHHVAAAQQIDEVPVDELPEAVLPYLRPSRYCQSDRLQRFAYYEFGHLPRGYRRVLAIQDWVRRRVAFRPQSSDPSTSAMDTLVEQLGVCRDFAHLMIALCRAANLPARFVSSIDYGADPALGPPDFHAYVEVYLGRRWYIFDPSGLALPMAFVRIGTGRDAADVAFATLFGGVRSTVPQIGVRIAAGGAAPLATDAALSTDD